MNVLVTSSRMPFALDEIRKFGRCGHRVFAADTFYAAPGSHSRWVAERALVAAPESQPARFIADIRRLVRTLAIDLLVPCFEEAFYLAHHLADLSREVCVLISRFDVLQRLHNKAAFIALARELGIATPRTTLVTSHGELTAALRCYPKFFARPVWSRGGIDLFTNRGPLAGALLLRDCKPTVQLPWIVQEYIVGEDLCSFSVAQHGHVVAHCTYLHLKEMEHAGGIVFESIVDSETLACVARIVEATDYHGQISMDFRRTHRGLVLLECNPRPTAGVHLMPDEMFVEAAVGPRQGQVRVAPAGVRRMYASALIRDSLLHWQELRTNLSYLFSDACDIYCEPGDRVPALFQLLSYGQVLLYRARHLSPARRATKLMEAYFDGISWNGQPIVETERE